MEHLYRVKSCVLAVMIAGGVMIGMIHPGWAEERGPGWSSGFTFGPARFFDGYLGTGFSGRAFVEYAPYIHEIGLKLTGGYFRFQDTVETGKAGISSSQDLTFQSFYLTGGIVYRLSRGNIVPFLAGNLGVYSYNKEDVK